MNSRPDSLSLADLVRLTYRTRWAGQRSEETTLSNACDVANMLGDERAASSLKQEDVERLVKRLRGRGVSDGTVRRKLAALAVMVRTARLYGSEIPPLELTIRGPIEGRMRILADGEELWLFDALRAQSRGEECERLARFLLSTGCRFGEAEKLDYLDTVSRDGRVWVTFHTTKNGKRRTIPLPNEATSCLDLSRVGLRGPAFALTHPAFFKRWVRARKDATTEDESLVPHCLRHTCITRLLRKGVPLVKVKEWAGHKKIETTMIYAHLLGMDLLEAADAI